MPMARFANVMDDGDMDAEDLDEEFLDAFKEEQPADPESSPEERPVVAEERDSADDEPPSFSSWAGLVALANTTSSENFHVDPGPSLADRHENPKVYKVHSRVNYTQKWHFYV